MTTPRDLQEIEIPWMGWESIFQAIYQSGSTPPLSVIQGISSFEVAPASDVYVTFADIGSGQLASPTAIVFDMSMVDEMRTEIGHLKARIAALERKTIDIKTASEEELIVLPTITKEQAKQEILELFQSAGTLFYSDIAERLRIDLPVVVEICQELEEEGEIEVDAEYAL